LTAAELFGGAGGLALGVAQAGFKHLAVIEVDKNACKTLRENQTSGGCFTKDWPLYEGDVCKFDYRNLPNEIDLLCAGVPCQPFSLGGKGNADQDTRDMFREVFRAANELRPKAILIENVKGLLRNTFAEYLNYVRLAISAPSIVRRKDDTWQDHMAVLLKKASSAELRYDVQVHSVNAADYGVPQWRDRVLIVAFRTDLGVEWSLPRPTHSRDALIWAQWKSGEYWKRHKLARQRPGLMSSRMLARLKALKKLDEWVPDGLPWRTVRDAIGDLPRHTRGRLSNRIDNHVFIPGARLYEGHSGSLLDEPAKTLKAGSHGVPGGENALFLGGNKLRYFTVRECARLQTFPDQYILTGAWTTAMRQIGNAVPVDLARAIASSIRARLEKPAHKLHAAGKR
jgi:DNA (cytosine-5)-methyltransferase 1